MNNQTIFISGANRGIGYALTRQMAQQAYQIIAGYRDEARSEMLLESAQKAGNIFPVKVDVTSEAELKALHTLIADEFGALDIIVNNAGININRGLQMNELQWVDLEQHFMVNVGGAFLTSKFLYPLLKAGNRKLIINISTGLASIERQRGGSISYSISKAALNMLSKQQALDYKADGITVISLGPGWIRTDMGGSNAPGSLEEAIPQIINVIETASLAQSGQFIDRYGEKVPY